jgi:hypothetical protein
MTGSKTGGRSVLLLILFFFELLPGRFLQEGLEAVARYRGVVTKLLCNLLLSLHEVGRFRISTVMGSEALLNP